MDELERSALLWPRHVAWVQKASDPARTAGQRTYAARRAKALRRTTGERLSLCEKAGVDIVCQCGPMNVPVGCGQHFLCRVCRRKRWIRERARIRRAWSICDLADDELVILATLTVRHTGDVDADWSTLMSSWRRFYKMLKRRGWAPWVYVGTFEVTPGTDGEGHPHLHIAWVQKGFIPWGPEKRRPGDRADLHTLWTEASQGASNHISLVVARGGKFGAGKYVSKYMTKGVDTRGFSPLLRARVLAASYQRRQIVSSVGFFGKKEPCCCRVCKSQFANLKGLADALGILPRWVPGFLRGERSYGAIEDESFVWTIDFRGGTRGTSAQQEGPIHQAAG